MALWGLRAWQTISTTIELIKTLCSMQLAVSLRKAFQNSTTDGKHNPVDTLVYMFCKLFGKYGAPENGFGSKFWWLFVNNVKIFQFIWIVKWKIVILCQLQYTGNTTVISWIISLILNYFPAGSWCIDVLSYQCWCNIAVQYGSRRQTSNSTSSFHILLLSFQFLFRTL